MNTIKTFENQLFGMIRTIIRDAEPWFVGKDVAEVLGYSNTRDALCKHVDEEDKTTVAIRDTGSNYKTTVTIINESGVYSLIFSSKLPDAKLFKHWVTSEVLPSIRKHGVYATDAVLKNLVEDPENAIALFKTMKAERDAKQMEDVLKFMHENVAESDEAGFDYCKKILSQKQAVKASAIASDYGMSESQFNQVLAELGLLYGTHKEKKVCAKCLLEGYAVNGTSSYVTRKGTVKAHNFTLWTQKGRIFLYENLKNRGLTPMA